MRETEIHRESETKSEAETEIYRESETVESAREAERETERK